MGIKAFRDPALRQDFEAPRLPIDVIEPHLYAVDWDADEAVFTVDGVVLRRCPRPPTYPLQLMLTVYDFPEWSVGDDAHLVPRLVVDRIAGDSPVTALQCATTLVVARHGEAEYEASEWDDEGGSLTLLGPAPGGGARRRRSPAARSPTCGPAPWPAPCRPPRSSRPGSAWA